jgi:hypothetical protein
MTTIIETSKDGKKWTTLDNVNIQPPPGTLLRFAGNVLDDIYAVIVTGETRIEKIGAITGLPEWALESLLVENEGEEITGDYRRLQGSWVYAKACVEYLEEAGVVLDMSEGA